MNKQRLFLILTVIIFTICMPAEKQIKNKNYTIVDTGQKRCFNNRTEIEYPKTNESFFGQDAQYEINPPAYLDNKDGTITDLNTGLIWQKTPDFTKRTFVKSRKYAQSLKLAGYDDWRLPTIKELFSIADFNGNMRTKTPYIDIKFFDFQYPDIRKGGRDMDAQYRSNTQYTGTTMRGDKSVFGFNFADGRIKSYPIGDRRAGRQFVRCVRGNIYGKNKFVDNLNGTIIDQATGLTWMKADSGKPMSWKEALKYAEDLVYDGHSDWRLPSIKELQSIIDYSRSPDAKDKHVRAAAIDPIFELTITESWFWSSTTHIENGGAYYACFGQGFSAWLYNGTKMNAHGAGAVRSDPKSGDPTQYPQGKGPQGDEIRIYNYVRCVRGGKVKKIPSGPPLSPELKNVKSKNIGTYNIQRHGKMNSGSKNQSFSNRFIQRLDKNSDGKISRSEFDGPQRHFSHLDKNKDGFINKDEAPKGPPNRRSKRQVRRFN